VTPPVIGQNPEALTSAPEDCVAQDGDIRVLEQFGAVG